MTNFTLTISRVVTVLLILLTLTEAKPKKEKNPLEKDDPPTAVASIPDSSLDEINRSVNQYLKLLDGYIQNIISENPQKGQEIQNAKSADSVDDKLLSSKLKELWPNINAERVNTPTKEEMRRLEKEKTNLSPKRMSEDKYAREVTKIDIEINNKRQEFTMEIDQIKNRIRAGTARAQSIINFYESLDIKIADFTALEEAKNNNQLKSKPSATSLVNLRPESPTPTPKTATSAAPASSAEPTKPTDPKSDAKLGSPPTEEALRDMVKSEVNSVTGDIDIKSEIDGIKKKLEAFGGEAGANRDITNQLEKYKREVAAELEARKKENAELIEKTKSNIKNELNQDWGKKLGEMEKKWMLVSTIVGALALAAVAMVFLLPRGGSNVLQKLGFQMKREQEQVREQIRKLQASSISMSESLDHLNVQAQEGRKSSSSDVLAGELQTLKSRIEEGLSKSTATSRLCETILQATSWSEEERGQIARQLKESHSTLEHSIEQVRSAFDVISDRGRVDSFRKVLSAIPEWTDVSSSVVRAKEELNVLSHDIASIEGARYAWERSYFLQASRHGKLSAHELAGCGRVLRRTLRSLLPVYRAEIMRVPAVKAVELSKELKILAEACEESDALRLEFSCSGDGMSTNADDHSAIWYIHGSRKAGNRTVLFPACYETQRKIYPGIVTYDV